MSTEPEKDMWTPERVREAIDAMCKPLDDMPRGPGFEEEFRDACAQLGDRERQLLWRQMRIMTTVVEHFRAMIGYGSPFLFGAAAEIPQVMSLLYAVDPKRLSDDVLDSLAFDAELIGGWGALPPALYKRLCKRARRRAVHEAEEAAYEAAEAKERSADGN